jgi:hypothetical protein
MDWVPSREDGETRLFPRHEHFQKQLDQHLFSLVDGTPCKFASIRRICMLIRFSSASMMQQAVKFAAFWEFAPRPVAQNNQVRNCEHASNN